MSTPTNPAKDANSYFIDTESAAEMARLLRQERLLTQEMGSLFPPDLDLSQVHRVLDIACGPGGWSQEVAFEHQDIEVVGIDIGKTMVSYATAQAQVQGLDNVKFLIMDATKPLDFATSSFDFVNTRSIIGFMYKEKWPEVVGEMVRVARPGGTIRLTEFDGGGVSNSPALERLNKLLTLAFYEGGRGFTPMPDGQNWGITPMLGSFLQDAGCLNIRQQAYVLDFSAGTEANISNYENFKVAYKLVQPFLVKMNVASQAELDTLYNQMLAEMMQPDFRALWYYLGVWGQKPA